MFTMRIPACAYALAFLSMAAAPSSAAPAVKPEISMAAGITLVGRDGFKGGAGHAMRGASPRYGGSNHNFQKFSKGHGVPRAGFTINPRYDRRHGKHHRRFPGYAIYGLPYVYEYAGDDCEGLYRRAVETDSRYWWNRYYECRDGYDD